MNKIDARREAATKELRDLAAHFAKHSGVRTSATPEAQWLTCGFGLLTGLFFGGVAFEIGRLSAARLGQVGPEVIAQDAQTALACWAAYGWFCREELGINPELAAQAWANREWPELSLLLEHNPDPPPAGLVNERKDELLSMWRQLTVATFGGFYGPEFNQEGKTDA